MKNLRITACYSEIENLTGIEDIRKITLVETSESSLSFDQDQHQQSLIMAQDRLLGQQMLEENKRLEEMRDKVLDMMEDYTADHVRKGNVDLAAKELKDISEGRAQFRVMVRQYKKMFATYHSENCSTLQSQLDNMNQKVEEHADSVWSKVELIQSQQPNQTAAAAPSIQSQSSTATTPSLAAHTSPGDLVYRKRIFQDQLLYLTEALCLPDSG